MTLVSWVSYLLPFWVFLFVHVQKFQNILVIELFVQLYFSLQIRFFVKNSDRDFLDGHLISFESAEKDSSKSASSEYLIFVDFNYKEMFKLF